MCLPEAIIEGALRIGIGKFTTEDEISGGAQILIGVVQEVRKVL